MAADERDDWGFTEADRAEFAARVELATPDEMTAIGRELIHEHGGVFPRGGLYRAMLDALRELDRTDGVRH